ncbi:hypothetical protein SDC9_152258 [bioreactor metagenome]|uniref:Uncharacterized protein n=1 Tax=bioreactor metagenome TaxID=1076179 RepID=A0A645EUY4_9ZZZZ
MALSHLLDIAVHRADGFLLGGKAFAAPPADAPHRRQHHRQHGEGDAREQGADIKHHGKRSEKGGCGGNQGGEGVVDGLAHIVDVVGKAAHQLAVGVGVEILQGQGLQLCKQVPPKGRHGALGNPNHHPGIGKAQSRAEKIDSPHHGQHFCKTGKIARENIVVDQRAHQIGPAHAARRAEENTNRHQHQPELIAAEVAHQLSNGSPQIFGLLIAALIGSAPGDGGMIHAIFLFSHRYSLLPAGTDTHPDKFRRSSSIPRGRLGPLPGPYPAPESNPRPRWRKSAGR